MEFKRFFHSFLFSAFAVLSFWHCASESATKSQSGSLGPIFEVVDAEHSGVDFINTLESNPKTARNNIRYDYYYNGAGVAVGDINNDGLPDLFFAANEAPNRLYINQGDFKFKDVTAESQLNSSKKNWSTGAVMADVNADGWLDIYVCQAGYAIYEDRSDRENLLFINNKDGTFSESAESYGINDGNESVSAAFFDYDKDGDLDLYVLNESKYAKRVFRDVFKELEDPKNLRQASGSLYRNDGGEYVDVTEAAGVMNFGYGLGLSVADINDDGWPDIYVSNDYYIPDFMYINKGDGTFTNEIKKRTKNVPFYGMGCDISDFNNDGLLDIASVDMAAKDHVHDKTLMASMNIEGFRYFTEKRKYQYQYMFNAMQLNRGNGTFSNIAGLAGVLRTEWSWATLLADFNNNGWKDYFVSNGYRKYTLDNDMRNKFYEELEEYDGNIPLDRVAEIYNSFPEFRSTNLMYRNNKDLTFTDVSEDWGAGQSSYSNGAVYADLDADGDLDLVVNNIDHKAFVLKNNIREKQGSNYLQFAFSPDMQHAQTYNAKIRLHAGDSIQHQEFHPTRGYAGSVEPIVHFGVGSQTKVDRVEVEWLNGRVQVLNDVPVNQRIELNISDAKKTSANLATLQTPTLMEEVDLQTLGLDFSHKENEFDDFAREILLPHRQSTLGPALAVGDINGDNLDDFYIGGAHLQVGALYVQKENGQFQRVLEGAPSDELDVYHEDLGAQFFDADGNGTPDLFVVSGGGDISEGDIKLSDRFYINATSDKQGVQFFKVNALDSLFTAGNVVQAGDLTGDGRMELFIGGSARPGSYPYPERSYILQLQGNKYVDMTAQVNPELKNPGIVKDAVWTDINADGAQDLVIVGEWMAVRAFINDGSGQLTEQSEELGFSDTEGWWYSVEAADVDGDGREDLIVGNVGLNTKFTASPKKPFHVFADDFDQNGVVDIVLSKEYKGKLVPARGRECSSDQMPFIKEKFPTYKEFALAELDDIYGDDKLESALHEQVKTFSSTVFINRRDGFEAQPLPNLAQISPIMGIEVLDINQDGNLDIIAAGNMYNTEVETPRYDAGNGVVLLGDGNGSFRALDVHESGLYAPKNVKDIAVLKAKGKAKYLLVANNDDEPGLFRLRLQEPIGLNTRK
ncbi:MAG: hypothetical protein GVX78_04700 [Bacteroidetes bacterium]|jgi:hypothetical protein|nr:hypothetical protein [Bacteroidota bacterium]